MSSERYLQVVYSQAMYIGTEPDLPSWGKGLGEECGRDSRTRP